MKFLKLRIIFFSFFLFLISERTILAVSENHIYSLTFEAAPRFFSATDFSTGFPVGMPEFGVKASLYRFPFGIEPLVGFSFVYNSTKTKVLSAADGTSTKDSYKFYTILAGLRLRPWDRNDSGIIPFVDLGATYRIGMFQGTTSIQTVDNSVTHSGTDIGGEFGGGCMISFAHYDRVLLNDISDNLGLFDYGMLISGYYLPAGYFSTGSIKNVGASTGWSAGGGLYIDW